MSAAKTLLRIMDTVSPVLSFAMPKARFRQHVLMFTFTIGIIISIANAFIFPADRMFASLMSLFATITVTSLLHIFWVSKAVRFSPLHPNDYLLGNLSSAANDYIEYNGNIMLSHYVSLNNKAHLRWLPVGTMMGTFDDKEFIDSLSPRHIRWIDRKFSQELEATEKRRAGS